MNSLIVEIGDKKAKLNISSDSKVKIDNKEYLYELIHLQNSTYLLKINNRFFKINNLNNSSTSLLLNIEGKEFTSTTKSLLQDKAEQLVSKKIKDNNYNLVNAPMPGLVLDIKVSVGDKIKKGDTLLILEAMKMENSIKSNYSGVIKEIFVDKNNPVEKGSKLISII
ncbi:MAG: hypothetical protein COW08_07855 [Ignavibacteriales bacterium CG12_big_fil_rev_8_21_14_0_65_30_8]|nr:MAG: hypothetical protein COW08_07855 [Ignavibacteriales bacterium CG12_big_fil_rev_8_21_14_0_65_30_8]